VAGIVDALTSWLVGHTYIVVFLATLIDATAFPFPGRLLLATAGAFAAAGHASALLVIGVGAAGVIITDHAWYLLSARAGPRLLALYCRVSGIGADCGPRSRAWLERWGSMIIVVGRFVAAVRVLTWPLARTHGVRYATFVALDVPVAIVWTAKWVVLGWLFGERWKQATSAEAWWLGGGVVALVVIAFVARWLWRRRRAKPRAPREIAVRASRGSPAAPPVRPRP
jgi:membrane protein DedA with SNARE-associated domain